MKAFGFQGDPSLYEETIPVPVGELCLHCEERIADDDCGVVLPLIAADRKPRVAAYHFECHLRLSIGSVKHQRGECGCVSGDFSADDDAEYPSKRTAAIAATVEFYRRRPAEPEARQSNEENGERR